MAELAIKKKRPKNLDLPTIRLPLPGILSIIHRISGAAMFLLLPFLLWLFQGSLTSPESFAGVKAVVGHPLAKIILLGLVWFYMHHFFRHPLPAAGSAQGGGTRGGAPFEQDRFRRQHRPDRKSVV